MIYIYPFKKGPSIRNLRKVLKAKWTEGFNKENVINWGNYSEPKKSIKNLPTRLNQHNVVCDKLLTLDLLDAAKLPIPKRWNTEENPYMAKEILKNYVACDQLVYGRKLLESSCGKGIVLFNKEYFTNTSDDVALKDLNETKLFTVEFLHKQEFRVHVFKNDIILVQQKRLKKDVVKTSETYKIRSYSRGWIFAVNEIKLPDQVGQQCIDAVKACHLDFGAVDIGYNEAKKEACIFEINSAPGLKGESTLEAYKNAITTFYGK